MDEKTVTAPEIEYDIFVRMPPKREYTVNLEIASIKKAKPKRIADAAEHMAGHCRLPKLILRSWLDKFRGFVTAPHRG